jgi:r1t holin
MFTKQWWKEVTERMIKTGAQSLIMFLGTDVTGLKDLDISFAAEATGFMMLLSLLTSIITTKKGTDSPSAVS